MKPVIHDIAGIGIGPFNLGLAALLSEIPSLKSIFFEKQENFEWHSGMMIDNTTVQVPFYADLVTLASPSSKFSFMCFLHHKGRQFQFAIREENYILRKEYNQYCNWVAGQLPGLNFGSRVKTVVFNGQLNCYEIIIIDKSGLPRNIFASHIVIGIGSVPSMPDCIKQPGNPFIFHSSGYLFKKPLILNKKNITIIGSGQSAAEIMYDLLPHHRLFTGGLNWFTKSERIFQMDFSKFALEMTSPDYINYFYELSPTKKRKLLRGQNMLYKGINASLISDIYNYLYSITIDDPGINVAIHPDMELKEVHENADETVNLHFEHTVQEISFNHCTEVVILATGYRQEVPLFLEPVKDRIRWKDGLYDVNRNYSIDIHEKEIFVQNAEMHTHGFNAPDLGMGSYRNACILNAILGYEHYALDNKIAFQSFGVSKNL